MPDIDPRSWKVETLRLTAFPIEAVPADEPPSAWATLVGADPELVQKKPRERALTEAGPHGPGWLFLETNPSRVDWRIGPSPDDQSAGWRLLGDFEADSQAFKVLMLKWLQISPPLRRLAFGARLLTPASDRVDVLRFLRGILKNVTLDDAAHDFSYRINFRRASQVMAGLEINRLSSWAAVQTSSIVLNVNIEEALRTVPQQAYHAARLDLDINTVPDPKLQLAGQILPPLFEELVKLGLEISYKGDVP